MAVIDRGSSTRQFDLPDASSRRSASQGPLRLGRLATTRESVAFERWLLLLFEQTLDPLL